MTQKNEPEQSEKRTVTVEISWRTVGYLTAVFLFIFVLGMQTYPLVPYPALVAFALLGIGALLLAITAPLMRKK